MFIREVLAQGAPTDGVVGVINLGTGVTLSDIFTLITNLVIGIGIALTVIFLVLGGIQYITSRGDAKAAETARASLTNAVIGFIIVISAVTIRYVITNVLVGETNTAGLDNIVT